MDFCTKRSLIFSLFIEKIKRLLTCKMRELLTITHFHKFVFQFLLSENFHRIRLRFDSRKSGAEIIYAKFVRWRTQMD
jgi:hypothetical protein